MHIVKRLVFGMALLLLAALEAIADEQRVTFVIDKMTCALCPITVAMAIQKVEGVEHVSVDYESKRATACYDDATTTLERITQASTNAGYPASKAE